MDLTWVRSAAWRATRVPADGLEASVWTVRGWAEVALACAVLRLPFGGLDEVVREHSIPNGGPPARRLVALRARAGPVPAGYPRAGTIAPLPRDPAVAAASAALRAFLRAVQLREPGPGRNMSATEELAWGRRHRPTPGSVPVLLDGTECAGALWRAWLRLPTDEPALVVAPRPVVPARSRVWRGIHEAAHLDHLAAGEHDVEFGAGLLTAEAYAMAVEIVALVTCVLEGDQDEAWWLREGLAERCARAAGDHTGEFAALPCLAAAYVTGALALLGGRDVGDEPPACLVADLTWRWGEACAAYAPAAAFAGRITSLDLPWARRPMRETAVTIR
ncbi:hypothetical protein ACIBG8_41630 [Nonomuraea sp. NPDC050556]|uniref:hypothetical protein n=1 Tax=Nonomuraea sp. NPDC050556 TaxID=3364369 RepID=UPI003787DC4F